MKYRVDCEQKAKPTQGKIRAMCKFALYYKNRQCTEYQGLLDTGSTWSLLGKDVVEKHYMNLQDTYETWNKNYGEYKTNKKTVVKTIILPKFSSKREIKNTTVFINPNKNQKYKEIFGMDFLVNNGINFLYSKRIIEWYGIGVPMREQVQSFKCDAIDNKAKITDNKFAPVIIKSGFLSDFQIHLWVTNRATSHFHIPFTDWLSHWALSH